MHPVKGFCERGAELMVELLLVIERISAFEGSAHQSPLTHFWNVSRLGDAIRQVPTHLDLNDNVIQTSHDRGRRVAAESLEGAPKPVPRPLNYVHQHKLQAQAT